MITKPKNKISPIEEFLKLITENKKSFIFGCIVGIIIFFIVLSKKEAILEALIPTKILEPVEQIDENIDMSIYNENLSIDDSYVQSNCPGGSETFYISAEGATISDLELGPGITPKVACWNDPQCEMYLTTTNGDHKKITNLQKNILLFCNSGNIPVPHEWYGNLKSNNKFDPKDKIIVFPTTKIFQCLDLENNDSVTFFFSSINAQYIRIYPLSWNTNMCLRFDLLKSGAVMNNNKNSRSYSSVKSDDETNRQSMLNSDSSWQPESNKIGEWAQIELSEKTTLNGIKIQASKQNPQHCIKTFCLHLSNNGETWDPLKNVTDETTSSNLIEPTSTFPLESSETNA
jgi:hypothetical protein